MGAATPTAPLRRGPRWRIALLLAVVLLAALWSGAWWLASRGAAAGLDRWMAAQAASGRQWTCPERRIKGFPFRMVISCSGPTFHGEVAGRMSTGSAQALRAGVTLAHPRSVAVDLEGPLYLRSDDSGYRLTASWSGLRLSLGVLPGPLSQGALDATRLAVTLDDAENGNLNLRAAHLSGRAEPSFGVDAKPGDEAWAFAASGVGFPTLDGFTGSHEPVDADGTGILAHANLVSAPTAARLEQWRQDGGRLQIATLKVSKGTFSGQASGVLALDEDHRLSGRLETVMQGFGPIARRFGIPMEGVKLGGLLSSLLSGRGATPPSSGAADAVRLPVTFVDGRLQVGVFQTPVRVQPFY